MFGAESALRSPDQHHRRLLAIRAALGHGWSRRSASRWLVSRCWTLFIEIRTPLVHDAAVRADQLGLDAAYRYSDYDTLSHRHLQDRHGLGTDRGRQVPRQLPARGPGGECHRVVHGAGLQPVRHAEDPCGPARTAPADLARRTTVRPAWTARPDSISSCRAATPSCSRGVRYDDDRHHPAAAVRTELALSIDYFDIDIQDTVSTFGPTTR